MPPDANRLSALLAEAVQDRNPDADLYQLYIVAISAVQLLLERVGNAEEAVQLRAARSNMIDANAVTNLRTGSELAWYRRMGMEHLLKRGAA